MIIKQRIFADTLDFPHVPDILRRIYAARGITDVTELDKQLNRLLSFTTLKGIEAACARLEKALRLEEKILIIGDFDADGATSTALGVSALRSMGAQNVDYLVPNRFAFGYGLTPAIVAVAQQKKAQLIITVDNGIASYDGVEKARALGMDVVITDHHLPAEVLPRACAIVNPNQSGCAFPSKAIAGVGVIFYVMLALRKHLTTVGWFAQQYLSPPNMAQFLDLVALGTVADVVAFDHNNRIMVNQGIARIRAGLCRPGIRALAEIAGRTLTRLREADLGFALAPRLNAAGRLDDMSLGIECLLTDNDTVARALSGQLDTLNKERRVIEISMKEQAIQLLEKLRLNETQLPVALCLHDVSWHQGVIGILAGRLKDTYFRPVIAFAQVHEEEWKGSARSVPHLNIRDVLAAIHKDNPTLISKFGGHAMAAGLSIHPQNIELFKQAFLLEVAKHVHISQCRGELLTDGPLPPHDITLVTAKLIQEGGPWGQQFVEPIFNNIFEILDQRLVGGKHLKLTVVCREGGEPLEGIAFNIDPHIWPNHRIKYVHMAYKLDINVYQGRSRLQLLIQALEPVEQERQEAEAII